MADDLGDCIVTPPMQTTFSRRQSACQGWFELSKARAVNGGDSSAKKMSVCENDSIGCEVISFAPFEIVVTENNVFEVISIVVNINGSIMALFVIS